MRKSKLLFNFFFATLVVNASMAQLTPFEKSGGTQTATYFEAIDFYRILAKNSKMVTILSHNDLETDSGYPFQIVFISSADTSSIKGWHTTIFSDTSTKEDRRKPSDIKIMINNGIHPGEPDGIDATMMLTRDIVNGKIPLPQNVTIVIVPIYNIGGSLNRNNTTRVNQNGPLSYGFRGNAQNLDLNRDFTKVDSKNARSFTRLFHAIDPDILIDNHVSDGADYQHTMTLISTQSDKLGGPIGSFLKTTFEPALYDGMHQKGWDMTPYVNFETASPSKGMEQFYDPPRYSSGYAALFQTMSFMPETHMLKPFKDRVKSTYDLMVTMIECATKYSYEIDVAKISTREMISEAKSLPLSWKVDSSQSSQIIFKGYEQAYKTSTATGLQRMYYDHAKPYEAKVKYYNVFKPENEIIKPRAYIIPVGWWAVTDLLKLNSVEMQELKADTNILVEAYRIIDYKPSLRAYEKHHKNSNVQTSSSTKMMHFLKGDHIIYTGQKNDRYLVEMLEPTGDDSFFSWNFFDAVLQQKEGYSDYRWEDIAGEELNNNPHLKLLLDEKRKKDPAFAKNNTAQLEFIYKNSKYYESAHMQYPVFRLN